MLLRSSSQQDEIDVDLTSVTGANLNPGIPHGHWLREITDACIQGDWLGLAQLRPEAEAAMGRQEVVDALTVAAAFNGITRVADATGIPLDTDTDTRTVEMRETTGIDRYEYTEKTARYDGAQA